MVTGVGKTHRGRKRDKRPQWGPLVEMEIEAGEHFQNPEEEDFCVCGVAGLWETVDEWVCQRTAQKLWVHPDSGVTEPPSYSGPVPYGFMQGH